MLSGLKALVELYLVRGAIGAGILHLNQDEGVQKVGGDHVWDEGRGLFLKHHGDDVISYVTLPLQLKDATSSSYSFTSHPLSV